MTYYREEFHDTRTEIDIEFVVHVYTRLLLTFNTRQKGKYSACDKDTIVGIHFRQVS